MRDIHPVIMLYWIFSTRLRLRTMFLTIPLPISFQARVDQNLRDIGKAEMKQKLILLEGHHGQIL